MSLRHITRGVSFGVYVVCLVGMFLSFVPALLVKSLGVAISENAMLAFVACAALLSIGILRFIQAKAKHHRHQGSQSAAFIGAIAFSMVMVVSVAWIEPAPASILIGSLLGLAAENLASIVLDSEDDTAMEVQTAVVVSS